MSLHTIPSFSSLFLWQSVLPGVNTTGGYWSASPAATGVNASNMAFSSGAVTVAYTGGRTEGDCVRCVRE